MNLNFSGYVIWWKNMSLDDDLYLSDILLLCVECQRPIKARINTPQWVRVEWIAPDGSCQSCWNQRKATDEESRSSANQRRA